ncbi:MAG: hypothetical protein HFJ27_00130 [Clostridia bacterium]|nr:hypothetical protein [Clostridia bacterium]
MELVQQLQNLKNELEQEAIKRKKQSHIIDIYYYKPITFDAISEKEVPLYLVEKEVEGKIQKQLQMGDTVIADISEDNKIQIRQELKGILKENDILLKLRRNYASFFKRIRKPSKTE